tara:strand:- start:7 stop:537 length:531 start_codon:yes stop_codon:yes gene_type:complete
MTAFNLELLVESLRKAALQRDAGQRVRMLMTTAFQNPHSIDAAMPDFAGDEEILFEDDSVSIWYCRFMPGTHVPPHDHQTTATIGVYRGAENNHFYLREQGQLLHKTSRCVGPGEVIAIKPSGIHSVEAANGQPSYAIHVYLAALTQVERSLFDWESGEASPFTDEKFEAMKRGSA